MRHNYNYVYRASRIEGETSRQAVERYLTYLPKTRKEIRIEVRIAGRSNVKCGEFTARHGRIVAEVS